jgi:hypothetical protein
LLKISLPSASYHRMVGRWGLPAVFSLQRHNHSSSCRGADNHSPTRHMRVEFRFGE